MSIPEQVASFLREENGRAYCDDCIREKVRLKRRQTGSESDRRIGTDKRVRTREGDLCRWGWGRRTEVRHKIHPARIDHFARGHKT